MNQLTKLFTSLTLPLLAGFIGSIATTPAIPTWYAGLNQPSFSPPNWLFAPVWTTLYILMGIALYRIWHKPVEPQKKERQWQAVSLFLIHLVFNAAWSLAFFGLPSPLMGLGIIIILLALISALIYLFSKIDRLAAYLLIPYLAWVSFATLLNLSIWYLN